MQGNDTRCAFLIVENMITKEQSKNVKLSVVYPKSSAQAIPLAFHKVSILRIVITHSYKTVLTLLLQGEVFNTPLPKNCDYSKL